MLWLRLGLGVGVRLVAVIRSWNAGIGRRMAERLGLRDRWIRRLLRARGSAAVEVLGVR
jgi:hypothetical protein